MSYVKRTWVEWGEWVCDSCEAKVSGKDKSCPSCGNPREKVELDKVSFDKPVVVTKSDELADALAGPDWHCDNCQGGNKAGVRNCKQCGGLRPDLRVAVEEASVRTSYKTEIHIQHASPKTSGTTANSSRPPTRRSPLLSEPELTEDEKNAVKAAALFSVFGVSFTAVTGTLAIVGGTLLLGLVGYGIWWSFQTHDANGVVTKMHWEQRVHRDNWQEVTREDWKESLWLQPTVFPKNGVGESAGVDNIRNCSQKYHHTRHYVCGSERVCRDATRQVANGESCHDSCHSNSNGSRTCHEVCSTRYKTEHYQKCGNEDKYCDEKIYKSWCSYDTWVWNQVDVKILAGDDANTAWAVVDPGPLDRLRRTADYRIDVKYVESDVPYDTYDTPDTESEYRTWIVGGPAVVVIYNMGAVAEIKHPEPKRDASKTPVEKP